MKKRHQRLIDARIAAGYDSAIEFVRAHTAHGIVEVTYRSHENGTRNLSAESARKYAPLLGVDWKWLMFAIVPEATDAARNGAIEHSVKHLDVTRTPEQPPLHLGSLQTGITEIEGIPYYSLPRFDAALSAGPGSIIDPYAEPIGFHLVEMSWIKALTNTLPNALAVLRVANDSMVDTLKEGDWILLDRSQTRLSRSGIYGLQVEEDAWVKRCEIDIADRSMVTVISDNPKYPARNVSGDDLNVIGRVLAVVMRKM